MSYAINKRTTSTMHCKVCESAKKPMSVITSHYPKNRDGFTVCPTLLSQQCRDCGKKGHTSKYCTRAPVSSAAAAVAAATNEKTKKKTITTKVVIDINMLYESSDEDEPKKEEMTEKKEKTLKKEKKQKQPAAKFCWATAESDSSGESESESD